VLLEIEVVGVRTVDASDLVNVTESLSGDQRGLGAGALKDGVDTSFTFIAMMISCLGLYGLSSYMAERRIKEIGVRKVLGASLSQIVNLMSMESLKLILIAFLIAAPLSWYGMNKWLEDFAYRTNIDLMVFLYAGIGAMVIALTTVGFESIKAATGNPVKSLRTE
jgi:putative ABC transport system permease protein